jgi:hypothetical protein
VLLQEKCKELIKIGTENKHYHAITESKLCARVSCNILICILLFVFESLRFSVVSIYSSTYFAIHNTESV